MGYTKKRYFNLFMSTTMKMPHIYRCVYYTFINNCAFCSHNNYPPSQIPHEFTRGGGWSWLHGSETIFEASKCSSTPGLKGQTVKFMKLRPGIGQHPNIPNMINQFANKYMNPTRGFAFTLDSKAKSSLAPCLPVALSALRSSADGEGHLPDPLSDQRLQVPPRWELPQELAVSAGEQTVCVPRRSVQHHRTVAALTSEHIWWITTAADAEWTRTGSSSGEVLVYYRTKRRFVFYAGDFCTYSSNSTDYM